MTEPTEEFLEMLAKSASHQLAIDRIEELEAVPRKQRYTTDSYDEHRARVGKRRRRKRFGS